MKFMNIIKKFGNKQDYVDYRNTMLNDAQTLLNDGKMEEYKAQIEDIKTFDAEYEDYVKAQADITAMQGAVGARNVLSTNAKDGIVDSFNNATENDPYNSAEYRNAFMNYVLKGENIPAELKNTAAQTTTSDVGAVIPNTILDRIVEKMEDTGKLLAKVTRTFYKGGVTVPTSAAKPTATWTTERGSVDTQKKSTGSVTFAYHKLKVVIAVSIAVDTVTMEVFERTVSQNIADAMVRALEKSIISGTGSDNNQPKGILKETAIAGQTVEITEGSEITYDKLCEAEGKLPSAYDTAEWFMTKKTYFSQIAGMTDSQGQPIARVNAGISGKPEYMILGRPVNFVSSDDMDDFATTVSADSIVAFLFRMEDYMLNTSLDITVKRYEDDDTDDQMTKAIMLADGKAIDLNSLVEVVVKNS